MLLRRIWIMVAILCLVTVPKICVAAQEPYLSQMNVASFIDKCNLYLHEQGEMRRLMSPYPVQEDFIDPELQGFASGIVEDNRQHVTAVSMYVKHGAIVGIDIATKQKDDISAEQLACALVPALITIGLEDKELEKFNDSQFQDGNLWCPSLGRMILVSFKNFGTGYLFSIRPQGSTL